MVQGGFVAHVDLASASSGWYDASPAGVARLGIDTLCIAAAAAHILAALAAVHSHSMSSGQVPTSPSLCLVSRVALDHSAALQKRCRPENLVRHS